MVMVLYGGCTKMPFVKKQSVQYEYNTIQCGLPTYSHDKHHIRMCSCKRHRCTQSLSLHMYGVWIHVLCYFVERKVSTHMIWSFVLFLLNKISCKCSFMATSNISFVPFHCTYMSLGDDWWIIVIPHRTLNSLVRCVCVCLSGVSHSNGVATHRPHRQCAVYMFSLLLPYDIHFYCESHTILSASITLLSLEQHQYYY